MSDMLTQSNPQTEDDYETSIRQLFDEMSQIEEQMDRDRAESGRLRVEIQAIKAITEAKLVRLEEETRHLTRAA